MGADSEMRVREASIQRAVRAIPPGHTAGYGEVARRAGLPGRARLVARVLAHSSDAELPWHRVTRSDGRVAFSPDSPGFVEQCARLRAEGVHVEKGRVQRPPAGRDLDRELWGPAVP